MARQKPKPCSGVDSEVDSEVEKCAEHEAPAAKREPAVSGASNAASAVAASAGLPPRQALAWLRLQRALAWCPERVAEGLREGRDPDQILSLAGEGAHGPPSEGALRRLEGLGVRIVPLVDEAYPPSLAALADAPPVLGVRGRVEVLRARCVAIVGARAATRAARGFARRLGRELAAAGFTIVSGLARGIDAEAHRGALEARGQTIGVLACGIDKIYPPEHASLADEMTRGGAILSEMPLGVPPRRELFPLRNRIISGLCEGVVVVEARRRSGTLITVRHALAQGREVFVVPGAVDGPFAEGTNRLLREGARPICGADDVIEDLGGVPCSGASEERSVLPGAGAAGRFDPLEQRILAVLEAEPCSRDALLIALGEAPGRVARAVLELDLAGQLFEERDGRLHRRRS
jgi:DNA processing protein